MAKYTVIVPGYDGPSEVFVNATSADVNDLGHLIFIDEGEAVAVFREWLHAYKDHSDD